MLCLLVTNTKPPSGHEHLLVFLLHPWWKAHVPWPSKTELELGPNHTKKRKDFSSNTEWLKQSYLVICQGWENTQSLIILWHPMVLCFHPECCEDPRVPLLIAKYWIPFSSPMRCQFHPCHITVAMFTFCKIKRKQSLMCPSSLCYNCIIKEMTLNFHPSYNNKANRTVLKWLHAC